MSRYKTIPDGLKAIIVFPNAQAFITGITRIEQDNKGNISAFGLGGEEYALGITGDDIIAEHEAETELALAYKLMPLCR